MHMEGRPFFCSWSGGKDSCLSLYFAVEEGGIPKRLLTMLIEGGKRSRSHGISAAILKQQAEALKIPLVTSPTTWAEYETNFVSMLKNFKEEGIEVGVFGA